MYVTREQYHAFSTPLEGRVPSMYVDGKGLITCGVGNLIDPFTLAQSLPWTLDTGAPAGAEQVQLDWRKLKDGAAHYSKLHWKFAQADTKCRLTDAAIDALVDRQIQGNEEILRKRFSGWDQFPADAQLAIMSIAWAVGAGFYRIFTNLAKAIDSEDWEACVLTCKIKEEGNPGVVPRNAKNRFCFHNAALTHAAGGDVATLWWPDVAHAENAADAAMATQAKQDAEVSLAAWHALATCPYQVQPSGAALTEFESGGAATPDAAVPRA